MESFAAPEGPHDEVFRFYVVGTFTRPAISEQTQGRQHVGLI